MTSSHLTPREMPVPSQKLLSLLALVCCVAVQFFVPGCDATNSQPSTGGPLSGNWQVTLQNGTTSLSQSGFVLQAGETIGGQFLLSGDCAGIGTVQGEVNGTSVSLTVNQPAQTIGLTGSVGTNGTSLSGDYSILGAGCGTSEVGTWTAEHITDVTGSFTGSFVSNRNSQTSDFAGTLIQSANTGASHANMSGSMTSSNAPCFADASISGMISGESVLLNFSTADGVALGQFSGTASPDAQTLTGTYDFSNVNTPITGCPRGDHGTATLTVHLQPIG
jgi:hypothetical protein